MAAMLGSCDKDQWKAFLLEGTWTGYIEAYYQDRMGTSSESFRTALYFHQDGSYGGTGYEVDYDTRSPYSGYYYCEFTWTVRDGSIYINYADTWNTVRIYDYTLNLTSFRGYMDDGTQRDIYFDLSPSSSFDWDVYRRSWRDTRGVDPEARSYGCGQFANFGKQPAAE